MLFRSFIDHRALSIIEQGDNDIPLVNKATNTITDSEAFATSTILGLKKRKAIYREGLGATLINDSFDVTKPYEIPKRNKLNNNLTYPYGDLEPKDTIFSSINYSKLQEVVASAFDKNGEKNKRTRSILVIYKDKIIAEKYDTNFNKNSKILGWSIDRKSVV